MAIKLDLTKEYKNYYTAKTRPEVAEFGEISFLTIEGKGEPESLAKIRKLMEEENFAENGRHHEIYLSDPRRMPEEKWKTILRQPIRERG